MCPPERPRKNATVRFCLDCSASSTTLVERVCPALERRREAKAQRERDRRQLRADRREAEAARRKARREQRQAAHALALAQAGPQDFRAGRELARAWEAGDPDAAEPLLHALARAGELHGAWLRFGDPLRHSSDSGQTWWRYEVRPGDGVWVQHPSAFQMRLISPRLRFRDFSSEGDAIAWIVRCGLVDLLPADAPNPTRAAST